MRHVRFVAVKTVWAVLTLVSLVTIVFVLVRALPGDPAITILGESATPEMIEQTRELLGLDRALPAQYVDYLGTTLSGDLGESFRNDRPVIDLIGSLMGPTLALGLAATVFAVLVGVPAGLIAARRRGTTADGALLFGAILGISIPTFWLALVLIYLFADVIPLFPTIGTGEGGIFSQLRALTLPTISLGVTGAAFIARVTRSSVLEVIGEDYVTVGRAAGLSERRLLLQYGLRNALPAIVGAISLAFAMAVANAVVIESIFSRRGLGSLVLDATLTRDYPVIQGGILAMAVIVIAANLLADLLHPVLEPRARA